jgi:hypothetical protein
MLRTHTIAVLVSIQIFTITTVCSQCIIAPPVPDACLGTEPVPSDNGTINDGVTKWYYGAPAVFNQLTVKGGTLIVCGDLTINNFFMDSGAIYIRPGAHLRIGGGAGIVLRGKSAIYNYGTLDVTSNMSLDNTWASPTRPNIVMNATRDAVYNNSNQYFTINNPNSFFVNRGKAEFWGLVTDYNAGKGSVCLGNFSQTRMTVLYNNSKHTYIAPEGGACVHVNQFSQFRDTLTKSANVNVCLGASHTSDASCIASGCKPNAWGTTNVYQFCTSCGTIVILNVGKKDSSTPPPVNREKAGLIYPNPFSTSFVVTWGTGEKPRFIYVSNVSGTVLLKSIPGSNDNSSLNVEIPGSFPPGAYFIKLVYKNQVRVQRILKIQHLL